MDGPGNISSFSSSFHDEYAVYPSRYLNEFQSSNSHFYNSSRPVNPLTPYHSRGPTYNNSLSWNNPHHLNPRFGPNESFDNFSSFSSFPNHYPRTMVSEPSDFYNNLYNSSLHPLPPTRQPLRLSSQLSASSKPYRSQRLDNGNALDIEKVKRGEDRRTTLMIRNIPNGYKREAFVNILNTKCKDMYDFLYLPIDQTTHCNMGYGYVNMVDLNAVICIYENFNNRKWPHTKSEKICSICYGRLQSGQEDLLHYCSDWSVMTSEDKYHPLFFKPKKTMVNGKERIEMVQYKPHIDLSMRKN